jgi:hypothetical protein
MDAAPTKTRTSSATVRWVLIIALGTLISLGVGLLAGLGAEGDGTARFLVFALTTAPVAFGGAWALVDTPASTEPEFHEETVEHDWSQKAGFGSFCDLVAALGVSVAVANVLSLPDVPLVFFLVLGMVSFPLRYGVLARRG